MTCSSSGHALTYNKMRKFKYAEPNLNLTKNVKLVSIFIITFAGLEFS